MSVAIKIENLGKKYILSHMRQERYTALRDVLAKSFKRLGRRIISSGSGPDPAREEFWALSDVSFEINQGDRVGIIGRNGAGKSTLLKILSRIAEPTAGRFSVKGRVASLLEVGTGFHPELTGRENIFLNGSILGMGRAEILRKFDEIVSFAEIEKFLDTPVKRYSSGMYVRLAFAVAAHLEPEILIVDEVLAVGDAQFQKKCLGKMEDVSVKEGRTVLFVSHNVGAINALCESVAFLDRGRLLRIGRASEVVEEYLTSFNDSSQHQLRDRTDRGGTGKARFTCVYLSAPDGKPLQQVLSGDDCMLVLGYESSVLLKRSVFKFTVYNSIGQPLMNSDSSNIREPLQQLPEHGYIGCRFRRLPFSRGSYRINASIEDNGEILDHVAAAFTFTVSDGDYYGLGRNITGLKEVCLVDHEWAIFDGI